MTDTTPALELTDIRFSYRKRQDPVLSIDEWKLERGARVFVHGPSGSGKSTLLNLLGGLLVPDTGLVKVLGEPISRLGGSRRDRFRARHIGIIFQQFNLIPWLSMRDNILAAHYFARHSRHDKASLNEQIQALLARLSIDPALLPRLAAELSIGQQQRVSIARALINHPEIVIADEPTSSLDADARDQFIDVLFDIVNANNSTLIFVSHDQSLATHFSQIVDLRSLNSASGKEGGCAA